MHRQIKNSLSSLILQIVTIIVGFILPKLMIEAFGSSVNGLGNSVTQFLSYITLLEAGVGGVVRASLYHQFANKDDEGISRSLRATEIFFRRIAYIFIAYILVLSFVYPRYINDTFDGLFTASIIIIISISSLTQYCFGITYEVLLRADQKSYICDALQILTCILNAVLSIILIQLGATYRVVKLVSAAVYVFRPIILNIYVRKHYNIKRDVKPDFNLLSQRWNALAHHIAWFLHTNTDIAIITLFGTLSKVSVYSVYYMIAHGISMICGSLVSGVEAMFGNIMATDGNKVAKERFTYYSMFMNFIVIALFSVAGAMIISFIRIYAKDFVDENYIIPTLGYCLIAAEMLYCIRIPYHSIVTAAGLFKQTQNSAFIEAALNIILSIWLINVYDLTGIAIATVIAMAYRTIYYIIFLSKKLLKINLGLNLLRSASTLLFVVAFMLIKNWFFDYSVDNYMQWIIQAIVCTMISLVLSVLYIYIFYNKETVSVLSGIKKRILEHH